MPNNCVTFVRKAEKLRGKIKKVLIMLELGLKLEKTYFSKT